MSGLRISALAFHQLGPFNLQVAPAECVVISGASGMGKSLLLRAIADLIPHEGEAWLDEQACSSLSPVEWRRRVALLPAESQWWQERIGDHFQQYDELCFRELGFNEQVMQWEVARCSTGERQRLALLRLLLQQPQALLLDEPTANVDSESTKKIETIIKRYRQQQQAPVIWVSHQPEQIARVADRHVVMEKQRLVEVSV